MKAVRRHQLATNALARELEGFPGLVKRHANTVLTVILVILAVALLVRWRLNSVEVAKVTSANELAAARTAVFYLTRINMMPASSAMDEERLKQQTNGEAAIATVLNTSDDPSLKAQAMIARGDLYWQLASAPRLPGATTQPTTDSTTTSDMLKRASDAYDEVLNNPSFSKDHDAVVSAHLGLAAIAENQSDWDSARKHLEFVQRDPDAIDALKTQAQMQLNALESLKTRLYLAPATQPSEALSSGLPFPLRTPATMPATQAVH
jgi:hypothetical protein